MFQLPNLESIDIKVVKNMRVERRETLERAFSRKKSFHSLNILFLELFFQTLPIFQRSNLKSLRIIRIQNMQNERKGEKKMRSRSDRTQFKSHQHQKGLKYATWRKKAKKSGQQNTNSKKKSNLFFFEFPQSIFFLHIRRTLSKAVNIKIINNL